MKSTNNLDDKNQHIIIKISKLKDTFVSYYSQNEYSEFDNTLK